MPARLAGALVLLVLSVQGAEAHMRIGCPTARSLETGIKTGPCGDQTNNFNGASTTLKPGPNTIVIEESIAHAGAPMRIQLSQQNDDALKCVLLDHVPHNDAGKPDMDKEATWTKYKFTVNIPDVACDKCSLQLVNPMTDKLPAGTTCREPGSCEGAVTIYHSCATIKIEGKTPIASYTCPANKGLPADWPWKDKEAGLYGRESAKWDANGWLAEATVPDVYKQSVGFCATAAGASPVKAAATGGTTAATSTVEASFRLAGLPLSNFSTVQRDNFRETVASEMGVAATDVSLLASGGADGVDVTVKVTVPSSTAETRAADLKKAVDDGSMLAALKTGGVPGTYSLAITAVPRVVANAGTGNPLSGALLVEMGTEEGGWLMMFTFLPLFLIVWRASENIGRTSLRAAFAKVAAASAAASGSKSAAAGPGDVAAPSVEGIIASRVKLMILVQVGLCLFMSFWLWAGCMFSYIFGALGYYASTPTVRDHRLVAAYGAWNVLWLILTIVEFDTLGNWSSTCSDAGDFCGDYCSYCGYVGFLIFIAVLQVAQSALSIAASLFYFQFARAEDAANAGRLHQVDAPHWKEVPKVLLEDLKRGLFSKNGEAADGPARGTFAPGSLRAAPRRNRRQHSAGPSRRASAAMAAVATGPTDTVNPVVKAQDDATAAARALESGHDMPAPAPAAPRPANGMTSIEL